MHAVIHPFMPGSPAYGLARLGTIDAAAPPAEEPAPAPHPVSATQASALSPAALSGSADRGVRQNPAARRLSG